MPITNGILLLSASPRKQGTSVMLLKRIESNIGGEIVLLPWNGALESVIDKMRQANTIVIAGPSYVNTYPARLFELLEAAGAAGGFAGQKLYGIINGGMPYIHTHRHGLMSLSLFAEAFGLSFQGGFVLGGGAMLDGGPLEKHLSKKTVVPAFSTFIRLIEAGAKVPDTLYMEAQQPPGKLSTKLLARLLTFVTERRLKKWGHDPDAPL